MAKDGGMNSMKILIKGILTIIHNNENFFVSKKNIYIKDDLIIGVTRVPEDFHPDKIIDGKDKLLIPGLINCHTHAYMSIFRNLADDLSFNDWLFKNVMPLEDKLTDEDAYWGANLSIIEMLKSGTTCFTDMHMHINQTTKAVDESGIRAVITRGLSGDLNDGGGLRRINEAKQEMDNYKGHERISFMLGPHAPYTCDEEYLSFIVSTAKENNFGINIHVSESENEIAEMKKARGCTPVEFLNNIGLFDVPVVAAHCVQITDSDMDILAKKNVNVAINPKSNMKLGNGFAPISKMLEKGINICIGTDGAASNNSLNLFSEMNAAALIYKGSERNAQAVSAAQVFNFATVNAAKALGFTDKIGTIEENKKADLVILDLKHPQLNPRRNLVSALSYSANGQEVDTVIVEGKILMENRELKTIDEEKVYYNIAKICDKLGVSGGEKYE